MTENFKYDVFLSYSSKDKKIARDIAERLRADNLCVWFDEWKLKAGDNIFSKIEIGLESSRTLVLLMSENAFSSDWTQLEANTIRFRDPLNKHRRFIPVKLDDVSIKASLIQFVYIDWHSNCQDIEYVKLLAACRGDNFDHYKTKSQSESDVWPTDLTLAEQLFLICHGQNECYIDIKVAAAVLGELVLLERIRFIGIGDFCTKKSKYLSGGIKILDSTPCENVILDAAMISLVKWNEKRGIVEFHQSGLLENLFGVGNRGFVSRILVNKKMLSVEKEKFLLIFTISNTKLIANDRQRELQGKIYKAMLLSQVLDSRIAILLGCCDNLSVFCPSDLKESQKLAAVEITEPKLQTNDLAIVLQKLIKDWLVGINNSAGLGIG